jgi:hypothetical protein
MGEFGTDLLQKLQLLSAYFGRKTRETGNVSSRARLATNPLPTGSVSNVMTMGMVAVAYFADGTTVGPAVTITSTFKRTSSDARLASRSTLPSAHR